MQCFFKIFSGLQASQTPLFFPSFYTEMVSAYCHVITPHVFSICCTCYLENNLKFLDSPPAQNPGYRLAPIERIMHFISLEIGCLVQLRPGSDLGPIFNLKYSLN